MRGCMQGVVARAAVFREDPSDWGWGRNGNRVHSGRLEGWLGGRAVISGRGWWLSPGMAGRAVGGFEGDSEGRMSLTLCRHGR